MASHFRSSELRQAFTFQTLYLGTAPARTPAAYVMVPFVEVAFGVWYPRGGMHQIALAMLRLARELGVDVQLDTPVHRILTEGRRAVGALLPGGRRERADAVVANAEWGYTQQELLERGASVGRYRYGCSGVLFLAAVPGPIHGPHHTFILSPDFEGNLADIFERRCLPEQPSIYVSRPTATDPALAPAGTELLYILVPCPTQDARVDWGRELPGFRKRVFDRLSTIGVDDLGSRVARRDRPHPGKLRRALQPDPGIGVRTGGHALSVRAVPAGDPLAPLPGPVPRGRQLAPWRRRAHRDPVGSDGRRRHRARRARRARARALSAIRR